MIDDNLQNLAQNNDSARELFICLKSKDYSYKILGASKAEELTGIDYYEIISVFKELDEMGVGDFVVGRKGHDSRILWNYDTRSVGQVGLADNFFIESLRNVPNDAVTALDTKIKNKEKDRVQHSFRLRKDFEFEIGLPSDFNINDLKRLKSWLELLVY